MKLDRASKEKGGKTDKALYELLGDTRSTRKSVY